MIAKTKKLYSIYKVKHTELSQSRSDAIDKIDFNDHQSHLRP